MSVQLVALSPPAPWPAMLLRAVGPKAKVVWLVWFFTSREVRTAMGCQSDTLPHRPAHSRLSLPQTAHLLQLPDLLVCTPLHVSSLSSWTCLDNVCLLVTAYNLPLCSTSEIACSASHIAFHGRVASSTTEHPDLIDRHLPAQQVGSCSSLPPGMAGVLRCIQTCPGCNCLGQTHQVHIPHPLSWAA